MKGSLRAVVAGLLAMLLVAGLMPPLGLAGEGGAGAGVLDIRGALENVRIGMRGSAADRITMIAVLLQDRGAEARDAEGARREWALARAGQLVDLVADEAERGQRRGEDLVEAMAALERATVRARERLGEILDTVPDQARGAIERSLAAMESGRNIAVDVLTRVAAGERPGARDAAQEHLERARGEADKESGSPGEGGAGRPADPAPGKPDGPEIPAKPGGN